MFRFGDRVMVNLTEKHELGALADTIDHPAKFVRWHADLEWADVELDKEHAGGTTKLSVPGHTLKKV